MFRYVVTVEMKDAHGELYFAQILLSRLTSLTKGYMTLELNRQLRKYPDAKRVEIEPIEESEYRRRKDFENRAED